ncbi:YoaK family protein [Streptomyces sp. NBC_01497]|uniref:YoaK family protein n=1 Tax=Streptomyces sp. NBC_01497 TaxID=2903885 RepID=UPI002E3082FD|nr:YoaK family protein [Streptomyces sp. NBC_01497]
MSKRTDVLVVVFTVLTVLSGVLDAASYLGLGHVFTANMTGNVVILGFAAAGAPGFSAPACLASLGGFLVSSAIVGRLSPLMETVRSQLLVALVTESLMLGCACGVAAANGVSSAGPRYAVIVLGALAMGTRNAHVRRINVAEMRTTVLTLTLTGLAFDIARGVITAQQLTRGLVSVVGMLLGAFIGALLLRHFGIEWPLGAGAVAAGLTAAAYAVAGRERKTPHAPAPAQSS